MERITLHPIDETVQPGEFLPIFNSNPDFIEATELITGKRAYGEDEVSLYL
jgi:hypothetical protein